MFVNTVLLLKIRNYSAPFTEWLKIVSNNSAKVVTRISMGIECAQGWNVKLLTSKNSAKLKQYYYFHAEFLEEVRYLLIGAR